jgi:penicillin-insensitive murein endopeptidase
MAGKPPAGATLIRAAASHRTAHIGTAAPPHKPKPAQSVGSPTEGHLVGGAHLDESTYLRIVPFYKGSNASWGLESLVGLVDRAGQRVHKQYPDAVLSVGHLSKHGGGEIDRHASHESGRDADIGFFIANQAGKPLYSDHFVAFLGDGTAPSWPGARFDDARNWALVAALVGDGHAHITHIFVATWMRSRILEYAAKINAPMNLRVRASALMAQPKGAMPHDDHFHVRIACPHGMEGCIEQPTARHGKHGALSSHAPPAASSAHAAAPGLSHGTPHPHVAAPPPPSKAKDDDSVPNLAPMVPGLDSAVIPKPIAKPDTPHAKPDPIDDPDGVLESH